MDGKKDKQFTFAAKGEKFVVNPRLEKPSSRDSDTPKPCFTCGEMNHNKFQCTNLPFCFSCKTPGHKSEECSYRKKENEMRFLVRSDLHRATLDDSMMSKLHLSIFINCSGKIISEEQVQNILQSNWPKPSWTWSVHRINPSRFMVRCPNRLFLNNIVSRRSLSFKSFKLEFEPWNIFSDSHPKSECKGGNSWFSLKGYPRNQWNWISISKTLKPFGNLCSIDTRNTNFSKLDELRIQLQCPDFSLIPDVLLLDDVDKTFRIEITRLTSNMKKRTDIFDRPLNDLANEKCWEKWPQDVSKTNFQWRPKHLMGESSKDAQLGKLDAKKIVETGDKDMFDFCSKNDVIIADNIITLPIDDVSAVSTSEVGDRAVSTIKDWEQSYVNPLDVSGDLDEMIPETPLHPPGFTPSGNNLDRGILEKTDMSLSSGNSVQPSLEVSGDPSNDDRIKTPSIHTEDPSIDVVVETPPAIPLSSQLNTATKNFMKVYSSRKKLTKRTEISNSDDQRARKKKKNNIPSQAVKVSMRILKQEDNLHIQQDSLRCFNIQQGTVDDPVNLDSEDEIVDSASEPINVDGTSAAQTLNPNIEISTEGLDREAVLRSILLENKKNKEVSSSVPKTRSTPSDSAKGLDDHSDWGSDWSDCYE